MKIKKGFMQVSVVLLFLVFGAFFFPNAVSAHCDTLDGPVISAARKTLETENANYVLVWVKPENEDEIRKALERARKKRKQAKNDEEKEQAETEFFEILVKIHREGEGAKYEGLRPAGSVEPEIALADKAVESGKIDEVLVKIAAEEAREVVAHLFRTLQEKSHYDLDNLPAGREYIEAYVAFIHTVEKAVKGEAISAIGNHH